MSPQNNEKRGNRGFLVNLVKNSIILTVLDRFTIYIYSLIKNGLFGYIFGSYKNDTRSLLYNKFSHTKFYSHFSEFKYGICRNIESCVVINLIEYAMRFFLGCRVKIYGTFLATFGIYTATATAVMSLIGRDIGNVINHPNVIVAIIMLVSAVPLILSKKTLSEALLNSKSGKLIMMITGFGSASVRNTVGDGGHMNTAFLVGIVCGALTYSVSPLYIIGAIFAVIWCYIVLVKPEVGVVSLFFAIPFLPTMMLAAIVIFVSLSYFIKLFRGKRIFRAEPVDIAAMAFIVLTFCGGVISFSDLSLKPSLLMVCLMLGYFLTVGLIRTREWIVKCSVSLVISATCESVWALILYFIGRGYSSDAWLDSEMFSSISSRAVGTLDNPNMLGEYLILVIPVAVSMLVGRGEGIRRLQALLCIGIMGGCLILTWSRGAWLGIIFAAIIYMLMWHNRSIWLLFIGVASIPILPSILPASIVSRFASIGNLSDSSTSYRVYIWRAVVEMISDNAWSGIGIGESAWDRVYPIYSYIGVEAAPHSHNLYLQIWLELGVFGILAFAIFVFMLYQSGFTFFSKLSGNSGFINPDISENIMLKNLDANSSGMSFEEIKSKTQLRISAIGPMCGILAVLVQGITDYSWYNYRLFLAFWLVCGLLSAYIRNGREQISESYNFRQDNEKADIEITMLNKKKSIGGTK